MAPFEEQFQQACDAQDLSGVVLAASSADGKFKYERAFGLKSPTEPLTTAATFHLASCTKLMTTIAALQCVDRGQIALDDDVSTILTELKDIQVLTDFKDGTDEPILKKAENKITLRHLLTHTSGLGHSKISPKIVRWLKSRGEDGGPLKKLTEILYTPLIFEPGTSWAYGTSLDVAGLLVMRLNSTTLEEYMKEHLWGPLGIRDITFHLALNAGVKEQLVTMAMRDKGDGKAKWTDEPYHENRLLSTDDFGGGGCIGGAEGYVKVLNSICANDGKLLRPETVEEMFRPQLDEEVQKAFSKYKPLFGESNVARCSEPGAKLNFGLGGLLILDGEEGRKGTLSWGGMPNLFWTIDRGVGMSLFYASNLLPYADRKSREMEVYFQKEMEAQSSKM